MGVKGRVHSIETCGTVDGPGIRFVLFLQGCPLRCLYCHNPDTWIVDKESEIMDSDEIIKEVLKYRSYLSMSGGGITITGGEPLIQIEFVKDIFKKCIAEGINTALDTSGYADLSRVGEVLDYTDMVLLDFKCMDNDIHKKLTGVENIKTLEFAKYVAKRGIKIWARHVLLPEVTDRDELLHTLGEFLSTLKSVDMVEILPFHKMGEYKWEELGYDYKLYDVETPSVERVLNAKRIIEGYGLKVR